MEAESVNLSIYDDLGERWYTAKDDPIALLRAESRTRSPWIAAEIRRAFPQGSPLVLDIGCGAGFLSNGLARRGFALTGIDQSAESLAVARRFDATGSVRYDHGDARRLPYPVESFDAVCALDFLEHVEDPAAVIAEASRVLRPGGLFFFHTFSRNPLSWLVVIKGVEWFVKNTPARLHVLRLFIKPRELRAMCAGAGMPVLSLRGFGPDIGKRAFWRMLRSGEVDDDFEFRFGGPTALGYTGMARKA